MAVIADWLTAARALLVVPLFLATTAGAIDVATVLLVLAWWTDFLDGRFARSTPTPTRLGPWDLMIDTMVGAALLGGLLAAGELGGWIWGGIGLVLFVWYLLSRNAAVAMTFQALAYGVFLAEAFQTERAWIGLPIATIVGIATLGWSRFVGTTLPTFFTGFGITRRSERAAEAD
jgi:phosphatidylglycerophosphate synthase